MTVAWGKENDWFLCPPDGCGTPVREAETFVVWQWQWPFRIRRCRWCGHRVEAYRDTR